MKRGQLENSLSLRSKLCRSERAFRYNLYFLLMQLLVVVVLFDAYFEKMASKTFRHPTESIYKEMERELYFLLL